MSNGIHHVGCSSSLLHELQPKSGLRCCRQELHPHSQRIGSGTHTTSHMPPFRYIKSCCCISMEPTALPTFENLPTHLCEPFLRAVQANPLQWLLPHNVPWLSRQSAKMC